MNLSPIHYSEANYPQPSLNALRSPLLPIREQRLNVKHKRGLALLDCTENHKTHLHLNSY